MSNKDHKSVTHFIFPNNNNENGGQKKRQRPRQLPFSRSSPAPRSPLILLHSSCFRMQRASWRYQILAKLRHERRPECVKLQDCLHSKFFGSRYRRRTFNLRIMVTVSSTRNFWIEYLSCNGDLVSKIKDQTEFCTLTHNVQAPDTSRK